MKHHLEALAARDFAQAEEAAAMRRRALRLVQKLITSLNPRPGRDFSSEETRYVVPDVIVKKVKGVWVASLNPDAMPRLRINRLYADILQRNRNGGSQQLASQLQEAKWLIKNVQQRFETILRVSQSIVDRQRNFFEHGDSRHAPARAAGDRRGPRPARIHRFARDDPEIHAHPARHLRAEVLLRQPRHDRRRRARLPAPRSGH